MGGAGSELDPVLTNRGNNSKHLPERIYARLQLFCAGIDQNGLAGHRMFWPVDQAPMFPRDGGFGTFQAFRMSARATPRFQRAERRSRRAYAATKHERVGRQ